MKHTVKLLSLALSAVMLLTLPALAAERDAEDSPAPEIPAPVRVWGTVTKLESGALELKNSDQNDPYGHIIVHLKETTPCVDAVLGIPASIEDVKDGETVCAWVGPAMTMSLPPQAAAVVVVTNLPADGSGPSYYEIVGDAISPASALMEVRLPVAGGEKTLIIPFSAEIKPYRTNNRVMVDDLIPGSEILVWRKDGAVDRVVLLPYNYRGSCTLQADDGVIVDGEKLAVPGKVAGPGLLPIRAVAEAAGYDVTWVKGQGAVVSGGGETLFTVLPGSDVVKRPGNEAGDWELTVPCVYDRGVTYLAARDLALLLELYFYA